MDILQKHFVCYVATGKENTNYEDRTAENYCMVERDIEKVWSMVTPLLATVTITVEVSAYIVISVAASTT